jgi:ribosomal protein S18 acetylase RimI-like enzyme
MQIDQFKHSDLDRFLRLAKAEGWICDRWEFDFLLNAFPQGCLVARRWGIAVAFVTAIRYGTSGWIGNLVVREEFRGQGLGRTLMEEAIAVLDEAGTETIWLTASLAGKPLYESLGFTAVDVINRWVGRGIGGDEASDGETVSRDEILAVDRAGWGDLRETIIDQVAERGRVFGTRGAFLVSQACAGSVQLGPWGGNDGGALLLLENALTEAGWGKKVFLDAPLRNTGLAALLPGMGFSVRGSNLLMCRGKAPAYEPERIFALASMGSMG